MPSPPPDSTADWLRLQNVTADQLRPWIASPAQPGAATYDPPLTAPASLQTVLAGLAASLPALQPYLDQVASKVRFELAPDRARFPRPFTLADDGTGHPLVSCPLRGQTSDYLILAHEIGHACQILASGPNPVPPIQREAAAFIAERLFARVSLPDLPDLRAMAAARAARSNRHGADLLKALDAPATPYQYRWNYPVAAQFAAQAVASLPAPELVEILTCPGPLGALLARLTI